MAGILEDISASDLVRIVFLAPTISLLALSAYPPAREKLFAYGARATPAKPPAEQWSEDCSNDTITSEAAATGVEPTSQTATASRAPPHKPLSLNSLLSPASLPASLARLAIDLVARWQVPHSYFDHYYVLSLGLTAFWGATVVVPVLLGGKGVLRDICASAKVGTQLTSFPTATLLWLLMGIQGLRRTFECVTMSHRRVEFMRETGDEATESSMLGVHLIFGLVFYAGMSGAVWTDSFGTICTNPVQPWQSFVDTLLSLPTMAGIALFALSSVVQWRAHEHLRMLRYGSIAQRKFKEGRKYSFPTSILFRYTLTPHYMAEVGIYTALLIIASAGTGATVSAEGVVDTGPFGTLNYTLLAGLFFVIANLGLTAKDTREWYAKRFPGVVVSQARMIPFIW